MTENELLTQEDLLRKNFNNSKIDTKDAKKFLLYFGGILQLGLSEGLIDEAGRNFIVNAITSAIEIQAEEDEDEFETNYVQIRNYMYIVSSYLQSKSNWDAWLELKSINSTEDAFSLINNAEAWVTKKIKDSTVLLTTIKPSVIKLNISNVTEAYQILSLTTKNAMASTSDITKFDLQNYHNMAFSIGTYILMNNCTLQNAENFFVELNNTIYDFCMEVSILFSINAKELVKNKKSEADVYFTNVINKVEAVNRIYKDKLAALKKEYNKNLKDCDDKVKIDMEYSIAKINLEKEFEEKLTKIDKQLEKEEDSQMEILAGEYSLYDLIKESAIYEMALKGEIYYPSTMKERSAMLMMIDNKKAISEFISGNKQLLTSEQIEFLKKIA